jgi:hypothetical protein
MREWLRRPGRQGNDPFSGRIPGDFTTPDFIERLGEENRRNVAFGASLQREASKTPIWAIWGYFILLIVVIIIFFTSPNYSKIAFGFIIGQAPLLLKELAKA